MLVCQVGIAKSSGRRKRWRPHHVRTHNDETTGAARGLRAAFRYRGDCPISGRLPDIGAIARYWGDCPNRERDPHAFPGFCRSFHVALRRPERMKINHEETKNTKKEQEKTFVIFVSCMLTL
jgi:hypothetical protein